MTNICKACGAEKAASEFYANDRTCKECRKAKVRANRASNVEHYRAFDRARTNLPHRVAAREAYQQTEAFRESHGRANRRYRDKHPERDRARNAVSNAVRDGRLVPWPVCALPDCDSKPEAHHPDYDQPLSVVWLCPAHHKQAHALVREEAA